MANTHKCRNSLTNVFNSGEKKCKKERIYLFMGISSLFDLKPKPFI